MQRMFLDFKDMVNEVDTDGTGSIDLPEFLSMMAITINDQKTEDDLREAFELFDHVSHKISLQKCCFIDHITFFIACIHVNLNTYSMLLMQGWKRLH